MTAVSTFRVRGVHVLIGMALFFGAVIAINVAFVVAAVQSFPGEDVRRSYLQGLKYNETLTERRAQSLRGWQARVELAESGSGAEVRVILQDADGAPLEGASVAGELRWPTDARLDRALAFEARGGGVYAAPLGALHQGRWTLRARADGGDGAALDFQAELTWPSTR